MHGWHVKLNRSLRTATIILIVLMTRHLPALTQPLFLHQPLKIQQLLQGPLPPPTATSRQPSQQGITLPSLWWVDRQFGQKLIIDWFAYDSESPETQQVQIFIRSNLWARFSYLERYAFVTHFGAMTRTYGYQMLLLDPKGTPLASYLCSFKLQKPQVILGAKTAHNQLIQSYAEPIQQKLPCSLWMNNAFPRNTL